MMIHRTAGSWALLSAALTLPPGASASASAATCGPAVERQASMDAGARALRVASPGGGGIVQCRVSDLAAFVATSGPA